MCGIAGYIGQGNLKTLQIMSSVMHHRGPDASGQYEGNGFGLAHSRLSVVDLSPAGSQPMFNNNNSIGLVFNGEIYNFKELKNELLLDGYIFRGSSDTEVILGMYQKYGAEVFSKIDGMFAIGIVDMMQGKLILARDRAGKKPLYWAQLASDSFIFASELNALYEHPIWQEKKPRISQQSLAQYLANDYVPTPNTIFENVFKLEPAVYMTVSLSNFQKEKICYWEPLTENKQSINLGHAVEKLDTLLSEAVKKRLVADVPVGIFLSGGLDSSILAYYAAQHVYPQKIKTFSIGFAEKSFDESRYAECVADHVGSDHHHTVISVQDCIKSLPDIFATLDEPIGDASIIPTYLVSKYARQYVTVALGGDGGDELFAGYPTFSAEVLYKYLELITPKLLLKLCCRLVDKSIRIIPISHSNFSFTFKVRKFLEGCVPHMAERHARFLGSYAKEQLPNVILNYDIKHHKEIYSNSENHFSNYLSRIKNNEVAEQKNLANALLYTYFRTYLLDEVLVKVDRASMMNSLEVRSPLLDTNVINFAFSLPYSFKKRLTTLKWILKKTMQNKLPKHIIYRSKKGFGLPISKWLNEDMKYLVDRYLDRKFITEQGLFNHDYISQIVIEHQQQECDHRKKLWTLLAFQMWWESYQKNIL